MDSSHLKISLLAISVGSILTVTTLVTGISILVGFSNSISSHIFLNIRTYMLHLVLDFIIPLLGGIILVVLGFDYFGSLHSDIVRSGMRIERSLKENKKHALNFMMKPDEKKVLDIISNKKDGILQSDLVLISGYSKVKIHRILKNLEVRDIIKRGRVGITNKIMLKS